MLTTGACFTFLCKNGLIEPPAYENSIVAICIKSARLQQYHSSHTTEHDHECGIEFINAYAQQRA